MLAKSENLKGCFKAPQKPALGRSQQQQQQEQLVDKEAVGGGGDRVVEESEREDSVARAEEQKKGPIEQQETGDAGDASHAEPSAMEEAENAFTDDLVDEKIKSEAESVLELLDKERKDIELRLHSSKSSVRRKSSKDLLDEDLQMPRIPAVYYEPKDTSRMTQTELRRERLLRRHLKAKFCPSPPEHLLQKMLQRAEGSAAAAAKKSRPRERPWAQSPYPRPFEETMEARKLRNVFSQDSTKCTIHKSPYLQPQVRFHTRDPGNRPGVTEGTYLLARPQPDGSVAMETKHVGQPAIEGTVTYRFSEELLKARQGISKPPLAGITSKELRPPSMVLDLEPFENFPKTKLNFAHMPQVRERAAMVKRRYINKVRTERSEIICNFRDRFRDQMRQNATPQKTQQRLVEMLNRFVPPMKQRQPQHERLLRRRPRQLPPLVTTVGRRGGGGGEGGESRRI